MRISDWSSDVCSSDLLADHGDGLAGADVEGDVVDHRLPLAGDAERGGEVGDAQDRRGARHGGGGGGAHDSPLRDRTSVVEGTSVAVRVELGGRRHLTKTTISITIHVNAHKTNP